jgi:hypothetical protein
MAIELVVCIQCGEEFEFPLEEQARYAGKGFDLPRRCPACRKHKARPASDGPHHRRKEKKRDYHLKYDN